MQFRALTKWWSITTILVSLFQQMPSMKPIANERSTSMPQRLKVANLHWLFAFSLLLFSLSSVSAQEALVYMTPWGGMDAEKERRIVSWASEVSGQDVEIQYPGGVQGVIEQLLLYRATDLPADVVWNHQSMHHQFDRLGAWLDLRPFVERDPLVDFNMFAPGSARVLYRTGRPHHGAAFPLVVHGAQLQHRPLRRGGARIPRRDLAIRA